MKKKTWFIMGAVLICSIFFINFNVFAMSSETEMLLKLLEKKGIVTTEEAADLKQAVEASVEQERVTPGKEHVGKMNVADRLSNLEKQVSKTAVVNDFLEKVDIHGLIEVEGYSASRGSGFDGNRDSSDITLATVELEIDARINEWVNGHLLFLYEDDDTEDFTVDEAIITIGNTEKFPLYLSAGKMYVPFGNFESNMIQDPLTLELGETRESAAQIGFEFEGFYGSVYTFNGDVSEGDRNSNKVDNYGANIGFAFEQDQFSFDIGCDYINDITDSDVLTDVLDDVSDNLVGGGRDEIDDYVSGLAAHLVMNVGPFQFIGEYVGAIDDYNAGEMNTRGKKANPESWNFEAAFTQEILGRETTFALAYQGTNDCVFVDYTPGSFDDYLALPEDRYMGVIGVNILKNTMLKLEYMHDEDYSKSDGGTNTQNDTVSAQVAVVF
ncbi:MAG: LbtU family siderophore porin [Deltaproteobacteria bacterium]|nr:LbtU family siderophore porin [Deltaproteobacteria bacterium]